MAACLLAVHGPQFGRDFSVSFPAAIDNMLWRAVVGVFLFHQGYAVWLWRREQARRRDPTTISAERDELERLRAEGLARDEAAIKNMRERGVRITDEIVEAVRNHWVAPRS